MDYGKSYSATWRVFRVNRKTWADGEQVTGIDSVNITRTADGSLLESGGLEATGVFEPDYYRIVMTAEQSGEVERVDVATLLFDITGGEHNYGTTAQDAEGYSVLYPASVTSIIAGEYAPAGVDGAQYAADLLRNSINAPVKVEGSFILNDHIVHEPGSWVLDAVWAILGAGGFIIQIDGRGVVHIMPKPTDPAITLDSTNMKLLSNGISYTTDISSIPNRYVVIDDYNRTIAVNDDPESIVSTVSRGYCVDFVDQSPAPINGDTYSIYAQKQLEAMSVMKDERTYSREYAPDVFLYSVVRASIDGIEGDLRVTSQTVKCDKGVTVTEKAVREVPLWRRT